MCLLREGTRNRGRHGGQPFDPLSPQRMLWRSMAMALCTPIRPAKTYLSPEGTLFSTRVSSLCRENANLLCIVPSLMLCTRSAIRAVCIMHPHTGYVVLDVFYACMVQFVSPSAPCCTHTLCLAALHGRERTRLKSRLVAPTRVPWRVVCFFFFNQVVSPRGGQGSQRGSA